VYYLAKVFAESLRQQFLKDYCDTTKYKPEQGYKFEPKEVLCAQIAGLCHDLGRIYSLLCVQLLQQLTNFL
jgi:HD superfamily phosphohydrolase